jgi:pimeloyl-ACP methyl ester carboxylesterase
VRNRFFTPTTKPLTKAQNKWIESAISIQVDSRGKKIQLWRIGQGPALLFIHGWNGRGVQFQRFFQPALDAGYSVLFFDAPAHGDSEGDMTNYLEVTECINSIFNHEVGKDIIGVVAHSLGASAIINHLSRHQNSLRVVLIAPALRLLELLFTSFHIHGVPNKTAVTLLEEVEEDFQIPLETQNPIDLIHQLSNNILIVHDRKDKTTPIGPSIQVAKERINTDLVETEGFGHNRLLKQKRVIEKAILFIKSKDASSQNEIETTAAMV